MFKVTSVALAATLFGLGADASSHPGCYPAFSSSKTYFAGEKVSATRQVTETENCSGQSGCPTSGVRTTTTTVKENYECREVIRCSQEGYEPVNNHGTSAWDREEECDPDITPDPVVPDFWEKSGCPDAYTAGAEYEAGDEVSVSRGTYSMVYTCKTGDWCGAANYEPGSSLYWGQAWTEEGACAGSLSPTASPSFDVLEDLGGCPEAFSESAEYEAEDKVSVDGFVYQCKSGSESGWCGTDGYEPNVGQYWSQAWNGPLGYCDGTISPTVSPSFDVLTDLGGCPDVWTENTQDNKYEEGDRVAVGELVFECKGWPNSGYCGQAGYEPMNEENAHATAWKDAWTIAGYCNGSMGPTESPSFDEDGSIGACPDEWVSGGPNDEGYDEGDMVAVTISTTPERKVAYRCKAWPMSEYCGQYDPTVFGGDQGWVYAGSCDGSMGPTAAPSFDALDEIGDGCPEEYSSSVDYEAGDQVTVVVGDEVGSDPDTLRQVVYECKSDVHFSKYCSDQAANLAPGKEFGYLGWTLKGHCKGTISPTMAPTTYGGVAWYVKCNDSLSSCSPGDLANPAEAPGSTDCSCSAGADSGSHCKRQICRYEEVLAYSSSTTYAAGDVIRDGTQRYKCKGHPATGWCSNGERYAPPTGDLWRDAWSEDGTVSPNIVAITYDGVEGNGFANPLGAPCTSPLHCAAKSPVPNPNFFVCTSLTDGTCGCTRNDQCGNNNYWVCASLTCVRIGDGSAGAHCFDNNDCNGDSNADDECTGGAGPGASGYGATCQ